MRRLLLAVALLASVVAPAAAASAASADRADAGARMAGTPDRPACSAPTLAFGRERYVAQQDDVARIVVLLGDSQRGESVWLSVGREDGPYHAGVSLVDGNGDGNVTVLFDAVAAGSGRPNATFRAAAEGDRVAVGSESSLDGPLPQSTYDLTVRDGACVRADATLVVEGPGPVSLGAYRGPAGLFDDLTMPTAVREALAGEDLSAQPDEDYVEDVDGVGVLHGDVVVLALRAPLASAFRTARGGNDTARFRALLGDVVTVRVVEAGAVLNSHEEPERYRLPDFGRWRVVADPGNDTYYVVVDAGAPVAGSFRSKDYGETGAAYTVETSVPGAGNASTAVGFVVPDAEVAPSPPAGRVVLAPVADATVAGTTNLPDGERVVVRLDGTARSLPVQRRTTVRDGRFAASFYLRNYDPGTRFDVVVRHGGETIATAPGRVGPAATVRFDDRRAYVQHVERVAVDHVELTHGGFVVVRRGSVDGPVVGRSTYLPPGDHSDVRVYLDASLDGDVTLVAVAHRDAGADETFQPGLEAAFQGGDPSDAARFVDVDGASTPTATPSPVVTPPGTAPPASRVPGPGAMAAAVALAAAALLAARAGGGRQ